MTNLIPPYAINNNYLRQRNLQNKHTYKKVFEKTKQTLFVTRFVDNRPYNPYITTYMSSYCKKY